MNKTNRVERVDNVKKHGYQQCTFMDYCDECGKKDYLFWLKKSVEYTEGDYCCLRCAEKLIKEKEEAFNER